MLIFLQQYGASLVIGVLLIAIVANIIRYLYKNKKAGRCISCDHCSKNACDCNKSQN